MMPKFTFMGWKFSTPSWLMYRAKAPMAVSWGKSMGGLPSIRRASYRAARQPEAVDST